jgi:hypothetical protein
MDQSKLLTNNRSGTLQGLTEAEGAERLQIEGFKELPTAKPRKVLLIAWEVLREPMILLLARA